MYGFGYSEEFIGEFMRKTGARPNIATKYAPLPWRFTSGSVVDACKCAILLAPCSFACCTVCCERCVLRPPAVGVVGKCGTEQDQELAAIHGVAIVHCQSGTALWVLLAFQTAGRM